MKQCIYIPRKLASVLCAASLMYLPVQAQTPEPATNEESQEQATTVSSPRQLAGFGVLAVLIGWMIWRNGIKRPQAKAPEELEKEDDDIPPKE